MSSLELFHGNIAGKRSVPELHDILAQRPDVLVLTEAYRVRRFAKKLAKRYGYVVRRLGRLKYGPEGPDIVYLIRKTIAIHAQRIRRMKERFYGPFNYPRSLHRPRRYQEFVVGREGRLWNLLGLHLPPGGPSGGHLTRGANKASWHESARYVKGFLASHALAVAIGDANGHKDEIKDHILPKGAHVAMASNVDCVIAKGANIVVTRLNSPNGMHGWMRATVTAQEAA